MLLSLLFDNPVVFIIVAGALIGSLTIHEFAHAYIADKLGDPTARLLGRVTLNPGAHLDPLGTLLLLVAGFGWGKPVPFDIYNLKQPKRDAALIALAGPLANFVLAGIAAGIIHLLGVTSLLATVFYYVVFFNIVLGTFNLIPVHPLDGFKVMYGVLPKSLAYQWIQMEPFGIYILLVLIITRSTSFIIEPVLQFALTLLGLKS